jgi:transcriptional regulator GlxA family with amidase domain
LAIDGLAHELGLCRRTLERRFLARVGLTPKRYARTVRLDYAMRLMRPRPAVPLSEIAYATGYCDQAHMNEDFRELGGVTPREYLAEANEIHHAFAGAAPRSPGEARD